jgi:hypothetical protein
LRVLTRHAPFTELILPEDPLALPAQRRNREAGRALPYDGAWRLVQCTITIIAASLLRSLLVGRKTSLEWRRWLTKLPDAAPHIPETERETEILPTIESIAAQRRQRNAQVPSPSVTSDHTTAGDIGEADAAPSPVEELGEEADQQGAFNPETGEINWDCPCLGGMAHGPCGEEFKAAFSCFVYSTEEPKGMDCIEKFKFVHSYIMSSRPVSLTQYL